MFPDAYVKVTLSQPKRQKVKKQTKVQHNSSNPCFNETFVFDITSKVEDLKYTKLMFTVYDHAHLRSDEVIGQANLGYDSSEESEFVHWSRILQNPCSKVAYTHKLIVHN